MKKFLENYKNAIVFAVIIIAALAVIIAVRLSAPSGRPVLRATRWKSFCQNRNLRSAKKFILEF